MSNEIRHQAWNKYDKGQDDAKKENLGKAGIIQVDTASD
jgi:hypothetical protein